jgi:signal peptidase
MSAFMASLAHRRSSGSALSRLPRIADRIATVACGVAIALLAMLLLATIAGYQPLIDHSDSMRPAIRAGDLVITSAVAAAGIHRGAIVTFSDPGLQGKLVTHRVVGIQRTAQRIAFLTRGDANSAPESWSVMRDASIGKVVARVPAIGRAIAWMSDRWVRTALLSSVALLLSTALLRRIWRA